VSAIVKYVGRGTENLRPKMQAEGASVEGFTVEQVRSYRSVIRFLNEKDRDILYLVFVAGKKQKDVQKIMGRSQPSLCYDIKRIRRRLRFVFYVHSVFDILLNFIFSARRDGSFDPEELDVLLAMVYTTSFTMASKILGMSQVRTRYLYDRCLRRMEELEMWEPYEIFLVVRSNLNIVRRQYGCEDPGVDVRNVMIP